MRKRLLTVILAGTVLAGCDQGGTGTGPQGDGLSQADLAALNRAILSIGSGVAASGGGGAAANRSAADNSGSFSVNFDETDPCPAGGTVRSAGTLSGSWNGTAQTGELAADFGVAHASCGVRGEQGAVIKLTGDPDLDFTLDAASNAAGLASLRITEKGAFGWDKGDGNSGRCTVDLTAELVAGTGQVRLTGNFCGWTVDGTTEAAG